jgi:hypothetical protein
MKLSGRLRLLDIIKIIISLKIKWTGHVERVERWRNVREILVEKLKEKTLRRSRRRWEDNIKTNLKEIRVGGCGLN